MTGEHATFLLFELTRFLSEDARIAAEATTAVTEARTTDTIAVSDLFTATNLERQTSKQNRST